MNRKLVGVVLGGSTAAARDRKMIALLDRFIHQEDIPQFDEPKKIKTTLAKKSVVVN